MSDFSQMSTWQLARAAQWEIKRLRQKATPEGRKYFVTLNGVEMLASEARTKLIAHITEVQKASGLC